MLLFPLVPSNRLVQLGEAVDEGLAAAILNEAFSRGLAPFAPKEMLESFLTANQDERLAYTEHWLPAAEEVWVCTTPGGTLDQDCSYLERRAKAYRIRVRHVVYDGYELFFV